MLSLESPRWSELEHAYGSAADIPPLLGQLRALPGAAADTEPWLTLWSALAHQGDVYSASFAAVPHVVAALAETPAVADESCLQFPAWVEICRIKNQVEIPIDLQGAYFESLARLPGLVAQTAGREWSSSFLACALAAIAAAKKQPEVAEALLEMTSPDVAQGFLDWHLDQ